MVCLVTGSSRGLGKAIALALGKRGHKVLIHFKEKKSEADSVALMIRESMALQAEVSDVTEVKGLVREVITKWGRIDGCWPIHDETEKWTYYKYIILCWNKGERGTVCLLCIKGRAHWIDKNCSKRIEQV
jgi:NAD(P)-dependent dehydrogenase (short-subunit alcohol dehydrogenase family)